MYFEIQTPSDASPASRTRVHPQTTHSCNQKPTEKPTETTHGQACMHAGAVHVQRGPPLRICPHREAASGHQEACHSLSLPFRHESPSAGLHLCAVAVRSRSSSGNTMAAHPAGTGSPVGLHTQATQHTLQCAENSSTLRVCQASRRPAMAHSPVQ